MLSSYQVAVIDVEQSSGHATSESRSDLHCPGTSVAGVWLLPGKSSLVPESGKCIDRHRSFGFVIVLGVAVNDVPQVRVQGSYWVVLSVRELCCETTVLSSEVQVRRP
jgi:hypothetical protein